MEQARASPRESRELFVGAEGFGQALDLDDRAEPARQASTGLNAADLR